MYYDDDDDDDNDDDVLKNKTSKCSDDDKDDSPCCCYAAAHNAPGVKLRVRRGIDGLDVEPNTTNSNVYRKLIQELNISDAQVLTYDFRHSPTANPHLVQEIQAMIEATYRQHNGGSPVTIISHSMGALLMHYFLTRPGGVSDAWKQRYIHAWIPIAPAYGGVLGALPDMISGDTRSFLPDKMERTVARSIEAGFWMLPHPAMYDDDDVLVEVHNDDGAEDDNDDNVQYYTAQNYASLFAKADFPNFDFMWKRVQHLTSFDTQRQQLTDPGVAVYPIYGTGIETDAKYVYRGGSLKRDPEAITDWSGDGTIQYKGLTAGNLWALSRPMELVNTTHIGVCWHADSPTYIHSITTISNVPTDLYT